MTTPIKIIIVGDFNATQIENRPITVSPNKLDDTIAQLNPVITLTTGESITITSMEDFSPAFLRKKLNLSDGGEKSLTDVLHDPNFQAAESSWRGVAFLADKQEDDSTCLQLLHSSYDDVRSRVYQSIMMPEYKGETDIPATLILVNFDFNHKGESLEVFTDLSKMAEAIRVPVVASTTAIFFGLNHLLHLPTIKNPMERLSTKEYDAYHQFRETDSAFWSSLTINRFLLRAPYNTEEYVEPCSAAKPEQYLWGRGIWILGANLIRSNAGRGHLVGLSGLGTGGEQLALPTRELPLTRTDKIQTPLEASFPVDITESLPYFGLSPLAQIPPDLGGQNQPGMIYLHLAANMKHIADADGKQFGALTVHTSLAYSLTMGRLSNLALKFRNSIETTDTSQVATELKDLLLQNLWKKEDDEISVIPGENGFQIVYKPHLVIHTRQFEITLDIP